ncbi:molybdopterin-dependent oxidoreductase-like protein [Rhodococcus sp. SMB37]|uniref:molybdopterin-dependent oxidoreductase n=1 Tax=Rhodococcus sp. SMB37 TaxID=2512213 RepID=UPI000B18A03E|nr:molybdopterin-dependent oxidoreductase [Rhodococcus sp. SMB37]TCN49854.1 molybdopterin-dependent oxidoreductase-like protein [Rhodococcus sp. SMB37]
MTRLRSCVTATLVAALLALTGACSSSSGDTDTAPVAATTDVSSSPATTTAAVPAGSVRLGGAVENPTTLSGDQLRAYPVQTQAVTFDSSKGAQSHTYDGAALSDILTAAVLTGDAEAHNPDLTFAILATGSDGYQATVSFGELSPNFGATPILVAYTEDGQPLDAPRLVVPGDVKGGRYVSDLTDLEVIDLRNN